MMAQETGTGKTNGNTVDADWTCTGANGKAKFLGSSSFKSGHQKRSTLLAIQVGMSLSPEGPSLYLFDDEAICK